MPRRSTSLSNIANSAIAREIGSKYDNIKIVADAIDKVDVLTEFIGEDIFGASVEATEASAAAAKLSSEESEEARLLSVAAADLSLVRSTQATDSAQDAAIAANAAIASSVIVNAYGNLDWGGFSVSDGELIVDYFDSNDSTPSLVDGEFILTY